MHSTPYPGPSAGGGDGPQKHDTKKAQKHQANNHQQDTQNQFQIEKHFLPEIKISLGKKKQKNPQTPAKTQMLPKSKTQKIENVVVSPCLKQLQ